MCVPRSSRTCVAALAAAAAVLLLPLVAPVVSAEDDAPAAAPVPAPTPAEELKVGPVPDEVRERFKLDPFYTKYLDAGGMPVVCSAKVSDAGLREAAYLIRSMLARRDDVLKSLADNNVRFAVMSPDEQTTDIPEHSDLTPKKYWDARARGLGPTPQRPAVSCGEENLLNLPGDRYPTENILIHEFAHAIHLMGLNSLDDTFDGRLKDVYDKAMAAGLWKDKYAAGNKEEYWAEGVQSYFDTNREDDRDHNHVDTREELKDYDPDLFALVDETFKGNPWRYVRYDERK